MELEELLLERFMSDAIKDKDINNFLGFLEGVILDHSINSKEINAIQAWMESNPSLYCQYPFDHLLDLLGQTIVSKHKLDTSKCDRFIEIIELFISRKFYAKNTRDVQRLHGLLAGTVCDGTLSIDEAKALNRWMKDHDYLEDDVFFQEVYTTLRPVRTKRDDLSDYDIEALFRQIKKYVDVDNHGKLRTIVESTDNPDFYRGQLQLENAIYCFTGSSSRFTKKEWKALVENNGATFVDDMKTTVDYLVICNKGNTAWAHKSYGRKFEDAKKWQAQGHNIKIVTEDDFVKSIGLSD